MPIAASHLASVPAPRVGVTQHSAYSGLMAFLVHCQILCLQEVQEDHYWEQLEPSLRMMGNAALCPFFLPPCLLSPEGTIFFFCLSKSPVSPVS